MQVEYRLRMVVRENGEIKTIEYECDTPRAADDIQYNMLTRLRESGGRLIDASVGVVRTR